MSNRIAYNYEALGPLSVVTGQHGSLHFKFYVIGDDIDYCICGKYIIIIYCVPVSTVQFPLICTIVAALPFFF